MAITVRLFATLREQRGSDRLLLHPLPGESVRDLFDRIFPHAERPQPNWPGPLLYAVNREYSSGDRLLCDGDEVAFVPPLGGGSGEDAAADPRVRLSTEPMLLDPLLATVSGPQLGGITTFSGMVRDHFEGRPVLHLDYEAYPEMALSEMRRLCDEIESRWPGARVAMAHRIGRLHVGDVAVIVACAAPHRAAAFEACRYGIDRLKASVPIWKKEVYEDGSTWKSDGGG